MSPPNQAIVLVVGDSMALPRPGVSYVETWPYLLDVHAGASVHVVNRSVRGGTSDRLQSEGGGGDNAASCFPPGADCLEAYAPSVAIVQLGIVDCAPRLIAKGSIESRLLHHMPSSLRIRYLSHIKKHRRRSADRAYVPLNRFRRNFEAYAERSGALGARAVLLEIAPLGSTYRAANPEADDARRRYNEELQAVAAKHTHCRVVAPFDAAGVEECVLEDGYHLNPEGHLRIAIRLLAAILAVECSE